MTIGIARKARDLSRGDVIGFYKGGKFHHIGRISTLEITHRNVYLRVDGKGYLHMLNPTTIVRVIGEGETA